MIVQPHRLIVNSSSADGTIAPASLESSSWLCVRLSRGNLGLDTNNDPKIVLPYDRLPAAAPTLLDQGLILLLNNPDNLT